MRTIPGLPRFREEEEVLLFLYGDSSSGFTSPVGLGQGKFTIFSDKNGKSMAVNGFWNRNLFRKLSPEAERRLGKKASRWRGTRGIPPEKILEMVESLQKPEPGDPGRRNQGAGVP